MVGNTNQSQRDTADSLADLAVRLSVSERTIHRYRKRGAPGPPFVLADWRRWIAEHVGTPAKPTENLTHWKERNQRAEALQREMRLEVEAGRLIDVDIPCRVLARVISYAKALLEELPDRQLALLPTRTKAADKRRFLQRSRRMVADVLRAISDGVEDLKAEIDSGT